MLLTTPGCVQFFSLWKLQDHPLQQLKSPFITVTLPATGEHVARWSLYCTTLDRKGKAVFTCLLREPTTFLNAAETPVVINIWSANHSGFPPKNIGLGGLCTLGYCTVLSKNMTGMQLH